MRALSRFIKGCALAAMAGCSAVGLDTHDDLVLSPCVEAGALRTDGYYMMRPVNGLTRLYVIYNNGIIRYLFSTRDIESIEDKITRGSYIESNARYAWGLFYTSQDEFIFERWHPGDGVHTPALVHEGFVLNDSTFVVNKVYSRYEGRVRQITEVYEFRQLVGAKPDSANRFVSGLEGTNEACDGRRAIQ